MNPISFMTGIHYFFRGFTVYKQKGLRRYAYGPLLINVIIFALFFYLGFDYAYAKLAALGSYTVPTSLGFLQSTINFILGILKFILLLVIGLGLLLAIGLSASLVANLIAAPFNVFLCEKIDFNATGFKSPETSLVKMSWSAVCRELSKYGYYLPRLLGVGLIFALFYFIPGLNLLGSVLLYGFGAWMLAFQYLDYPADNRKISVKQLKAILKEHLSVCMGFGFAVMFFTSIPVLNLIVLPVSVAAAGLLWIEVLQSQLESAQYPGL